MSGSLQFTAVVKDSSGNVIANPSLTWSSSAPDVATINPATGLVTGIEPGTAQVTATSSNVTSAALMLAITPGFLLISPLNDGRGNAPMTVLDDGTVLIAGGLGLTTALNSAEIYNPAARTFTFVGNLQVARYNQSATLLDNGEVLLAGGLNSSGQLESAELYDPSTQGFTLTGSLTVPRNWFTATHLQNGDVLIAGGVNSSGTLASAELYDPAAGTFSATGSMTVPRGYATATLLNNGLVLIAGGMNSSGTLASAELYDPATGVFTATGDMNSARYVQTATLLNSGDVLIAGGSLPVGGNDVPLASAELYNPAAGTFAVVGNLNTARLFASATELSNGTVLIAGGEGGTISPLEELTSAEIYDPVAQTFSVTGSLINARQSASSALLASGDVLFAGSYAGSIKLGAELYEPATFTPPGLESITVTPATATISPGAAQQYIATGNFPSGPEQLNSVTWSSSSTGVAQISNDSSNPGIAFAAGSPAVITITATAGSVTGEATLTVN